MARKDRLDELGDRIIADALDADCDPQFRLDAYKALSGHKIGMLKAKKGEEKPADDGTTMDALTKRINGADAHA